MLRNISIIFFIIGFHFPFLLFSQTSPDIPAFPQAEGFGAWSRGGRGGKVIYVENLNDNGPGSLRAAVDDPEPRTVVFRVSGTIELKSYLLISKPYITIAGQTAPGDGICLKNYPLKVYRTHDVIIRGIRVRPGTGSGLPGSYIDAIDVEDSNNVIIDHCSASWSVDEILNTNHETNDITIQWCIFSESLNNSVHEKGEHGYAATIGGSRASYHHNLFAHNLGRNPSIGGSDESRTEQLDFRNNVVYNWVSRVCDGKPRTMNFVSNYYKSGPATPPSMKNWIAEIQASEKYGYTSKWYIEDNYIAGYPDLTSNNWGGAVKFDAGTSMALNREYTPFENANYRSDEAEDAYLEVLDHAGVIIPRRDTVDNRVIEDVKKGTATIENGIIDLVGQAGGWPELLTYDIPLDTDSDGMPDEWETSQGLNLNDPEDRNYLAGGEVYTNLERYINILASEKPFILPPVNVETSKNENGKIQLNWTDISNNETSFVILRKLPEGTFSVVGTVPANVTEFTDTLDISGNALCYSIYAMNDENVSLLSKLVSIALGVSDVPNVLGVNIYPNPGDGMFFINYNGSNGSVVNIEIFDPTGKKVHTQRFVSLNGAIQSLDLRYLSKGNYFIKVQDENRINTKLLIIR